ncbi:hypothetical protein WAI453_009371 [Rhynchosporium graminicola]
MAREMFSRLDFFILFLIFRNHTVALSTALIQGSSFTDREEVLKDSRVTINTKAASKENLGSRWHLIASKSAPIVAILCCLAEY